MAMSVQGDTLSDRPMRVSPWSVLRALLAVAMVGASTGSPPWPELAASPPMGWNGWLPTTRGLIPGYQNNETMYYAAADILVSSGLRDAGYDTILVTCAGWQRDKKTGKLMENPTVWPRGYKAFIDYLHARKLKIGAYGDTGEYNCCRMCVDGTCWREPGQLGNEELDVQTWADWGVDHIVIDNCDNANTTAQSVFEYRRIHDALVKVGKPMIYGIWDVGSGKPWAWAPDIGHYWRTGPDLGTRWGGTASGANDRSMSLMLNYDLEQAIPNLSSLSGPGSFAFLDNLAVGLPADVPHSGDTGLTIEETRTHFSLWCIMASPLILNHNIFPGPKAVDPEVTKIITNKEVIAINQDILGKSAVRIDGSATWNTLLHRTPMQNDAWRNGEQLEKPLANGDIAILLFNRLNTTIDITLNFEDVNDTSKRCWDVRDLWQGADLGRKNGEFVAKSVPPHGCRMLRLSNGTVCGPPPPPPLLNCPEGYTAHDPGYWHNTDPCNSTFAGCTEDHANTTVAACAKKCSDAKECVAFELFLGSGTGPDSHACYIFHDRMEEPFTPCNYDCMTCVRHA